MGIFGRLFKPNVEKLNFNRLVKALHHKAPKVQEEAAREIAKRYWLLHRPRTVKVRGKDYDEKKPESYWPVDWGSGNQIAEELLISCLNSEEFSVRTGSAIALGKIRSKKAVHPLIELAKKNNEEAIRALGLIGDKKAVEHLIRLARDRKDDTAIVALGRIGDSRAIPCIMKSIESANSFSTDLLYNKVTALGNIGDPTAIEPLIREVMSHARPETYKDMEVFLSALEKMAKKNVEALIQLLDRESWTLVRTAMAVLERLEWKPVKPDHIAIAMICDRKWEEVVKLGSPALSPLYRAMQASALKGSGKVLHLADENFESGVLDCLSKIADPSSTDKFISWLSTGDDKQKMYARRGLIKIGRPAGEKLITALSNCRSNDSEFDNRRKTEFLNILSQIGETDALDLILELSKDKSVSVRKSAIRALGNIGDIHTVETLIDAIKDSGTKADAAQALKKITGEDFGEDPKKWEKWWRQNEERFQKK